MPKIPIWLKEGINWSYQIWRHDHKYDRDQQQWYYEKIKKDHYYKSNSIRYNDRNELSIFRSSNQFDRKDDWDFRLGDYEDDEDDNLWEIVVADITKFGYIDYDENRFFLKGEEIYQHKVQNRPSWKAEFINHEECFHCA